MFILWLHSLYCPENVQYLFSRFICTFPVIMCMAKTASYPEPHPWLQSSVPIVLLVLPNWTQDLRGSVSLWKPWVWKGTKVSENLFEVHKQCAIKTDLIIGSKIAGSLFITCVYFEHAVEGKWRQPKKVLHLHLDTAQADFHTRWIERDRPVDTCGHNISLYTPTQKSLRLLSWTHWLSDPPLHLYHPLGSSVPT